jgi:PAS domain S-box-containing protein
MWQSNPYAYLLLIGAVIIVLVALIVWRRCTALSAKLLLLFLLAVAGHMLTYAVELLSTDLMVILTWVKLEHTAIALIPILWLLFILAYTGRDSWLQQPALLLVFTIPLARLLLVWTTESHDLFYTATSVTMTGRLIYFERSYGLGFWVTSGLVYGVMLAATVIIIYSIIRDPDLYRDQFAPLLLAVFVPWIANIMTVFPPLNPLHPLDLMPFGLALGVIPLSWSLLAQRLFKLVPDAHQLVFRSIDDAVFVLDRQRQIVDANEVAEKMAGARAADLMGRRMRQVFPDSADVIERYEGRFEARDELILGAGVKERHFDLSLSPLRAKRDGHITGFVVVMRDITRRHWAEMLLRQYGEELETRNRDLDAFSHTVAHDLRAPLSVINGYAEILREMDNENLSDIGKIAVEKIQKASLGMNDMISNLLLLSSLTDPSESIVAVDMRAAAKSAAERFHLQIEERGIKIDIDMQMPLIYGHPTWLEAVFANLLSNAIKYIGKDNASPSITLRGTLNGTSARYEVCDNGVGISAEDQKRLFDMFSRFHRTEAEGMGIGLSIVLRIVTRLGGKVGVESREDEGSTFWFTLPARSGRTLV